MRETGAVASARAAEIYGLDILAEKIQVSFGFSFGFSMLRFSYVVHCSLIASFFCSSKSIFFMDSVFSKSIFFTCQRVHDFTFLSNINLTYESLSIELTLVFATFTPLFNINGYQIYVITSYYASLAFLYL